MSAVLLEGVSYRYAVGDGEFYALRSLTLAVQPGEMVAITGASGSGKTTLMNLLGTLATTKDGKLTLAGEDPGSFDDDRLAAFRNRSIGFVFQQFHLLPRLSALENVMLPLSYLTPRPDAAQRLAYRQRALALLARLGIPEQADKYPATLSGGQKQRVAIARALLMGAKILLADEPTGALDSRTSREVLRIFAELNAEGRTVILITHDPEVTAVARRKIELRDGVVVADVVQAGMTAAELAGPPSPEASAEPGERATIPPKPMAKADPAKVPAKAERAKVPAKAEPASIPAKAPKPAAKAAQIPLLLRLAAPFAPLYDAWQALASSKLRTALTSLGLIIGVSSITIMLTLGSAAQDVILKIFNQAGSDRIYVGPDQRSARDSKQGGWIGLGLDTDFIAMQNAFAGKARIVPLGDNFGATFVAAGNAFEGRVQQVFDRNDLLDKGAKVKEGRMIAPHEFANGGRVALVGADFAGEMFPSTYKGRVENPDFPLGETVLVRGNLVTTITIVGVLAKRDTTFESTDVNQRLYVPMAMTTKYTGDRRVRWMAVVPEKGVEHRWMADAVTSWLRLRSGLKFPFRAHVPEEIIGRIMLFIKVFQGLTALVGGLCILVGGIGIMNIMLVTIAERIREIGLRKALGASGADVTRQFLTECILLCAVSGVVGTLLGALFCNLVAVVGHWLLPDTVPGELLLNPVGMVAGIATAGICGVVFGMMPAMKAARLDPSEALRSE